MNRLWRWCCALIGAVWLSACSVAPTRTNSSAPATTSPVETPVPSPQLKIGLALGGGGNRGFAHIGVLKVLDEAGIHASIVAGTSAGSAVGALYASGLTGSEIERLSLPLQRDAVLTWVVPSMGFASGEPMESYINQHVGRRLIEQLPKAFGAVATDLQTGRPVVFQRGNTGQAVRASCAVPGLFQPVRIGDRLYADGGLVQPIPVSSARKMGADFVIAVDVSTKPTHNTVDSVTNIMLQTFDIMGESINRYERQQADVVIQPDIQSISVTDLKDKSRAIRLGETAAKAALPELLRALERARSR